MVNVFMGKWDHRNLESVLRTILSMGIVFYVLKNLSSIGLKMKLSLNLQGWFLFVFDFVFKSCERSELYICYYS